MCALLVGFLVGASSTPVPSQTPTLQQLAQSQDFFNETWEDGKAEVATYDATTVIQGKPRSHTTTLITRFENYNREKFTPADWPYGSTPLLPVITQHQVSSIRIADSPRHQMASLVVERGSPGHLLQLTTTALQWNGQTFKEFRLHGDRPEQYYSSPHDGAGSGRRPLVQDRNTFFEEHLPLLLRTLPFREGQMALFSLHSPQVSTGAAPAPPSRAILEISRQEEKWLVEVDVEDGRRLTYHFANRYPHPLEGFTHSDGRTLTLRSLERDAYWENLE